MQGCREPALRTLIRAEVSAAALRANLARIREVAPASRVMAVVKANAYGHGLVPTALCLAGADADAFGVARLDEAMALRGAGIRGRIVLLEGVFDAEQLAEAARQSLDIVVHEAEQLALLEATPHGQRFVVWLKIDTGMNRLGFRPSAAEAALLRLQRLGDRVLDLRLMTHFASADERDSKLTRQQLARFDVLTQGRGWARSLANSAAIFAQPDSHADWVRPGLALYGVSPFADQVGAHLGLHAAMRLVSSVIAVREVPAGETVGYGGVWRAVRDSRVAIIAGGYGDGLPRALPNGTPVLVRGRRAQLAGRVSMDMIAVDVTGVPGVQVGDPAVLWGPELPVEEIAAHAGTLSYELLCAVSQRVPLTLI
ncbi:MAG: alanine racemase [Steroidobacteraceae bacterium]